MRLLPAFVILLVALTGVGCASHQVDYAMAEPDKPGSTFLFLGLWNVFSQGLNDVADNLNQEGYHAQSLPGPEWQHIGDQIVELERKGELKRPLILGGHSLGADKALYLAKALERKGIDVDYICLLDATNPPKVPANVKRCHNIYLSHPLTDWFPAFRGIAVQRVSPRTELVNYDVRYAQSGALSDLDFNHFDIETDPGIQALMTELIRAQLDGNPDVASIFPPNSKRVEQ
ncbi:MAG: thioesterase domain-containing protein [Phycisphaeraceae bacterium]